MKPYLVWSYHWSCLVLESLELSGYHEPLLHPNLKQIGIQSLWDLVLNLVLGFSGQFTLGQAGFMAIGAYSCSYSLVEMTNI